MLIYSSPWLIAVSHVLLRLLMPRHSPYALCNLNLLFSFALSFAISFYRFGCLFFTTLWWQNCSFLPFFLERPISIFSIAFSISVRLLYSVFNDHLHSLFISLFTAISDVLRFRLRNEVVKTSNKTRRQSACEASFVEWSVWMDSNHRPRAYQARALTT